MSNTNVKTGFEKVLNGHGYGFHYTILEIAKKLKQSGASNWKFESAEFPVEVQRAGTRIDFILRLDRGGIPIFLLAECKKANPALSDWCFAKAPYVRRNRSREYAFLECMVSDGSDQVYSTSLGKYALQQEEAYHLALEVKSCVKGQSSGSEGRGAIEKAASQICRGLNGMIEFLARNTQILEPEKSAVFLPVIFTTARTWTSDADLASADISTGEIDFTNHVLTERPWLLYQYHLSPGIKHSYPSVERPATFGELLDSLYIRTIPIVSAAGIEPFLKWASDSSNYLL